MENGEKRKAEKCQRHHTVHCKNFSICRTVEMSSDWLTGGYRVLMGRHFRIDQRRANWKRFFTRVVGVCCELEWLLGKWGIWRWSFCRLLDSGPLNFLFPFLMIELKLALGGWWSTLLCVVVHRSRHLSLWLREMWITLTANWPPPDNGCQQEEEIWRLWKWAL